ncbi:MAG: Peptidase Lit peptidase [Mucilaginibacter sp.]|nr:Peptidase Lit peptidase [Mucilaginibacter sp.]
MWNSDTPALPWYQSPIRVLYDRIINSFYENSPLTVSRLDALVEEGLIRRGIFFNPEQSALKTPKVDLISKRIEVHEPFMSFLWCLCYNFIFLNEATQKLAVEDQKVIQINNLTTTGLNEMNYLIGWAFSLRDTYSEWPEFMPNPAGTNDKVRMANALVTEALKFLLYHEVAHLANNHVAYLSLVEKPAEDLTLEELFELKVLEAEADNYAFDMLVGPELNDATYNQAMGCVVAQLSALFIISETRKLKQLRHPDIDTRLFNLMNKIKFEDVRYQMNIDQTLNMGLSFFLHIHKVSYLPADPENITWHETFEEVLRYLYDQIDKAKDDDE